MPLSGWPLVLFALAAAAQSRIIDPPEPIPANPPIQRPESRRPIPLSPEDALAKLTSGDPSRVLDALSALGLSSVLNGPITSATLTAVNLDAEPRLERLLTLRTGGLSAALVLQQKDATWWELGTFLSGGLTSQPQDPFIELRETVWPGTKDIILHSGGSQGTGVGEVRLSILRLLNGHLYDVFTITESSYNWAGAQSSRLTYPNLRRRSPSPRLLVRTQKRVHGRTTSSRQTYQWDAARFAFLPAAP